MRQLLSRALGYTYAADEFDYGIDKSRLPERHESFEQPYVVFIHSTAWESKCWPENYWRDLAAMVTQAGLQVVLPWGNEAERERALRIAAPFAANLSPGKQSPSRESPSIESSSREYLSMGDLTVRKGTLSPPQLSEHSLEQKSLNTDLGKVFVLPPLSIAEKATIISGATATVGLDTGLSHIAAALDIPSVTIYGATDPLLVGATGNNQVHVASDFECVKCHEVFCSYAKPAEFKPACFVGVRPERVWRELRELLKV
jgi:heptosyltransferase-1